MPHYSLHLEPSSLFSSDFPFLFSEFEAVCFSWVVMSKLVIFQVIFWNVCRYIFFHEIIVTKHFNVKNFLCHLPASDGNLWRVCRPHAVTRRFYTPLHTVLKQNIISIHTIHRILNTLLPFITDWRSLFVSSYI